MCHSYLNLSYLRCLDGIQYMDAKTVRRVLAFISVGVNCHYFNGTETLLLVDAEVQSKLSSTSNLTQDLIISARTLKCQTRIFVPQLSKGIDELVGLSTSNLSRYVHPSALLLVPQ